MLHTLYDIILSKSSTFFSVTMSLDVTDVWQCDHDVTLTLILDLHKENKRKNKNEKIIK